jgi:uncharacterized membrane protein HdeD (DUF308 family)
MKSSLVTRVLLGVVLGFLAGLAFIVGASAFENSRWETLAGCVAILLYCVACQFWLPRKGTGGFPANWPILAGMIGGLLAQCVLLVEGGLFNNWPLFVSGCVGGFVGILLSARRGCIAR